MIHQMHCKLAFNYVYFKHVQNLIKYRYFSAVATCTTLNYGYMNSFPFWVLEGDTEMAVSYYFSG